MLSETEVGSGLTAAIEPYVMAASHAQADAAWRAVQVLDAYTDEQFRDVAVQTELTAYLAAEVPGWPAWIEGIRHRLDADGLILIRGTRFDPSNVLLVALLGSLGTVTGEGNPSLHAVHDLFPIERPPGTPDFELYFHTGSYFRTRPHELLALLCVRPGSVGGVSRLARIETVCETMRRQGNGPAVETLLQTPVLFKRPIRKGRGYFEAPILTRSDQDPDHLHVRYERRVERGASGRPGGYSAELQAAIAAFEAAAYTPGAFIEYALQQDELLIIDNRRVLHARTAVVGGAASGRHLKRVKAYVGVPVRGRNGHD